MDFSKKYLLKYGWEEGEGLGKMKDGIKTAIKPKLKFDKAGMGYNPSVEFTDSWWFKVYNDALEVTNVNNEVNNQPEDDGESQVVKVKSKKRKIKEESFSDMFIACEGRTVHKGGRHGLQLNGKLQRLEQQELELLTKKRSKNKVRESNTTDILVDNVAEENTPSKHKRKKKNESKQINTTESSNGISKNVMHEVVEEECIPRKHKSKKKNEIKEINTTESSDCIGENVVHEVVEEERRPSKHKNKNKIKEINVTESSDCIDENVVHEVVEEECRPSKHKSKKSLSKL